MGQERSPGQNEAAVALGAADSLARTAAGVVALAGSALTVIALELRLRMHGGRPTLMAVDAT